MHWLKNLNIRTALISIIAVALLILALVTTLLNNRLFTNVTADTVENELLSNQLQKVKARIVSELNLPLGLARGMSQNLFLRQWASDGEPEAQRASMLSYLDLMKRENQAVTAYWVSNVSNYYYNEEGILTELDPQVDTWFFDFLASGRDYKISLDYDISRATTLAFVDYIARSQGEVLGVAGIGYSVNAVSELVLANTIGDEGYVFIADNDGNVIIHPDSASLDDSTNLATLLGSTEISDRFLASDQYTFVNAEFEGTQHYIASIAIPDLGWHVIGVLPEAEPMAAIRTALGTSTVLNLALALGFVVLMSAVANRITKPILNIAERLSEMAQHGGDLTQRLDDARQDEIGQLAEGFNAIIHKVRDIMVDIKETERVMDSSFMQLRTMSGDVQECVNAQVQESESVATAANEMNHSIQEVSELAQSTADKTESTRNEIQQVSSQVLQTQQRMQQLNDSNASTQQTITDLANQTQMISSVVDTISSISEQTNLLALNAAIEAARAGEQGRGFAVVADEVRSLAARTKESTAEIKDVIERLQSQASAAVDAMTNNANMANEGLEKTAQASDSLNQVVEEINEITNMNTQVATATQEQSSVISELSTNVTRIADMASTISGLSDQTRQVVQELDQQKEILSSLVAQFRTE